MHMVNEHAVQGEHLVVGVGGHEIAVWCHEFEANADGHQAADEEEDSDREAESESMVLLQLSIRQPFTVLGRRTDICSQSRRRPHHGTRD